MKRGLIVTIDGPAGAGKSTVARRLAKRLRFRYLDTGALYRAITLKALQQDVKPNQSQRLSQILKHIRIDFQDHGRSQKVLLDRKDVTRILRLGWVTDKVFQYARLPQVRKAMLVIQRRLGARGKIVAEGRDLGSVVFPKADIKFYLTATIKERARRRYKELRTVNRKIKLSKVIQEIRTRDRRDKTRKLAPLKKPREAICVDTTHLTIKQVVDRLFRTCNKMRLLRLRSQ